MTKEEAIEIIKRNCTAGSQLREACKVFIPELFENKDERIRKDIIALIEFGVSKGSVVTPFSCTTKEEDLAYLEKQKEQKPLSTEETELNSIAFLEQLGYTCVPPGAEQKPAEWSEEDEKIIRFYEADYNNQIGNMSIEDVINMRLEFKNWLVNRLKSLRPQSHWKPSEEQMSALDLASLCAYDDEDKETLKSLYHDLQKL